MTNIAISNATNFIIHKNHGLSVLCGPNDNIIVPVDGFGVNAETVIGFYEKDKQLSSKDKEELATQMTYPFQESKIGIRVRMYVNNKNNI